MKKIICISMLAALLSCTNETKNIYPAAEATAKTDSNDKDKDVDGTINGGGGKGVLCTKGGTTTLQALDLYEADVLYNLKSTYNPANQDEAFDLIANLLAKHYWNPSSIPVSEIAKHFKDDLLKNFADKIRFISAGKKLNLINDSFEPIIEQGCEMVQVATYYDESILLIDKSLWDQMDWLNKTALLTHELVYFKARSEGATNSMASRKLVGQLFSSQGARPMADGIPSDKTKFASCYIYDTVKKFTVGYFYIYDSTVTFNTNQGPVVNPGVEAVFNFLPGIRSLFRISTFFIMSSMQSIFSTTPNPTGHFLSLKIDTYPDNVFIYTYFEGNGKGKMDIVDNKTNTTYSNLEFTCHQN